MSSPATTRAPEPDWDSPESQEDTDEVLEVLEEVLGVLETLSSRKQPAYLAQRLERVTRRVQELIVLGWDMETVH